MATEDEIKSFQYQSEGWGICTNLYPDKIALPSYENIIQEIGEYLPNRSDQNAPKPDPEARYFIRLTREQDAASGEWYGKLKVNNVWRHAKSAIEALAFDYNPTIDILFAKGPRDEKDRLVTGLPNWGIRHYMIYKVTKGNTSRSVIVWERDPENGGSPIQFMTMYPWCLYTGDDSELPDDIA